MQKHNRKKMTTEKKRFSVFVQNFDDTTAEIFKFKTLQEATKKALELEKENPEMFFIGINIHNKKNS